MNQKENIFYKNNPRLYSELKKLYTHYRKQCTRMILAKGRKRNITPIWRLEYLYNWILEMTKFFIEIPPTLIEKCKWIIEGRIDYPKCKNPNCSNKVKKYHSNGKYANNCCNKCAGENPQTLLRRQKTCMNIYGSTNVFSSDYGKKKIMKTCLRKYGVKFSGASKEKIKNTQLSNLKKYGVKNVNQVSEIKSKGVKTAIQRHGQLFNFSAFRYDGRTFDSTWEIAMYIYLKEHNIQFEYHNTNIVFQYYTKDGKLHTYYPDFIVEGKIYEIKGTQFFDNKGRPYNKITKEFWYEKYTCMRDNGVIILTKNDITPYLNYVNEKYGKSFLISLKVREN